MAEIHFPTKVAQDLIKRDTTSIKQDTTEILNQFPISGGVKSVQRGVSSLINAQTYVTVPISPVNVDKAFINIQPYVINGQNTTTRNIVAGSSVVARFYGSKNDAIDIIHRGGATDSSVFWEVIEFD